MTPLGTLYEMLGGDGYSEDSAPVCPGLSDAAAVPEDKNAERGWVPAIVINYPVKPSVHDEVVPRRAGVRGTPGADLFAPPSRSCRAPTSPGRLT